MQTEQLIITVIATDRPGVVRALSDTVLNNQGNWLESSLSRLCGQFAGVVHLSVPSKNKATLLAAFDSLQADGINVTSHSDVSNEAASIDIKPLEITVEANDRPGIVEEITAVLAKLNVNVEQMQTECVSASMAGYELFRADLAVSLPEGLKIDQLEASLENVSDDLVVSLVFD